MFKDLTPEQIDKFGSGFITLAHLSVGGLAFAQATSERPFNLGQAVLGTLMLVWLYLLAAIVMQVGTRRKQASKKDMK
ncbi:MAG: hypothetical protein AAF629_31995 [Chloroflexota bacterium]